MPVVTFQPSGRTASVDPGTELLDAAKLANVETINNITADKTTGMWTGGKFRISGYPEGFEVDVDISDGIANYECIGIEACGAGIGTGSVNLHLGQ